MKRIGFCFSVFLVALAGCGDGGRDAAKVRKGFTVTGSQAQVESFAKQQAVKNASFTTWSFHALGSGQTDATVFLPASAGGSDVALLKKDAEIAGLSYYSGDDIRTGAAKQR